MTQHRETPSLLIVEDEQRFRATLKVEFEDFGYDVLTASSAAEALEFSDESLQFAIVDLRLGDGSGLKVVEHLRKMNSSCRIVVLTGYGSISTAVEAVKRGASQYLTKPIRMDKLRRALHEDAPATDQEAVVSESLAKHEREYIEYTLLQCNGNITKAAERLGLHRQSLQRKLKKYSPI